MIPVKIEALVVGMMPSPAVIVLRPLAATSTASKDNRSPDGASVPTAHPSSVEQAIQTKGDPSQVLPIWVGPVEAMAIGMALESINENSPRHTRPATHDLIGSLLTSVGGRVDHVEITKMEGSTFFANIVIEKKDDKNPTAENETTSKVQETEGTKEDEQSKKAIYVDARPSDAIAIAIRNRVPIFVADDIMKNSSFPIALAGGLKTATPEQIENQMNEFKDFVANISPEDFSA